MSSPNYLKAFGVGVDVAGQLQIDKALRRKETSTLAVDRADTAAEESLANRREIKTNVVLAAGPQGVTHSLGVVPKGAFVIQSTATGNYVTCTATSAADVTMDSPTGQTVTIWIE